ncbi:Histidine kinase-like ATPase domain-containing protein [Andreprevotia lacus DSM 23236]|jgi:CheY-like chemotaxis protein|uniref:Histidine kinase-like ATPase domain-containing protein n=1 Tax=Andreprevotia lacus DSM 23236 TaxID=1121001 RepID=A0A1W1X9H4_9NEIS|nr:fused response regulator/phosphatase [Andreprevotia lacus]SMC20539.1 Histidine kinase-like ATPase domain-containing protein [Andreprevotia lacus DSM 23236]
MKILVVDDTEAVLLLISRFVEALGHVAIPARNGGEALDIWRAQRPDLVLMDMMMPVMSGPEAAVAIKREAGESWVPIVFVTGVGEENRLAEAIEQGADDYITKPVNFRVLEAKLKAFNRTLELNRKVREQSAKLADYYDRTEEEKRVVRHLMEQMVNAERLYDPQLDYWLSPAESLSGDLIAAARTPGQTLHVMLADGIGHGLTAALNVLPLTQPFYSMTEKGYAISDILIEMNDKVRQVLPVGRFVAVSLISIDEAAGCIEVWNGGMPTIHVLDDQGVVRKMWKSAHLPLGIVPTPAIEVMTERYYFQSPGMLVAFSDGLTEARNPAGQAYGQERLLAELAKVAPDERLTHFQSDLAEHLQGGPHHDDISMVLARFGNGVGAIAEHIHPQGLALSELLAHSELHECNWRYSLVLGADELKTINTVPFLMTFVNEIGALKQSQSDVFLILTELFVNALDHGVLGVPSSIKHEEDGMGRYLQLRAQTLAGLQQGRIEIDLAGVTVQGQNLLRIRLKDSGSGFDWKSQLTRPAAEVNGPCGRGIALVRALCMALYYQGSGNEVVAYYLPHAPDASH